MLNALMDGKYPDETITLKLNILFGTVFRFETLKQQF